MSHASPLSTWHTTGIRLPASPEVRCVWLCDWGQWNGGGSDEYTTPFPGLTHENLLQESLQSLPLASAGSWCPGDSESYGLKMAAPLTAWVLDIACPQTPPLSLDLGSAVNTLLAG